MRELLATTRLLTLTGAGGSGKTRLASRVVDWSADSAWWVELAPIREAVHLLAAVLAAAGVEQGSRSASKALVDSLRDQDAILVLDNCEHIVEACAELVELLLKSCPRLRVLATSREALGIAGERAWLVSGMGLPGHDADFETITNSESVALFSERARSAQPGFMVDQGNAATIAAICRRLDGLPLAIELAAARVPTVPLVEIVARLDEGFAAPGSARGGGRTARHRTLRQAISWSYDLLEPAHRVMLQCASVFAGDFDIRDAESVCASDELGKDEVLDCIGALVDKSLIAMRESEGAARYYMLETIRQYARDLLREAGQENVVKERHARTFMELMRDAEPHFITRARPEWVRRVQLELDNVRVALAWTHDHDQKGFIEFAGLLGWFWYSSGLWGEGRQWLEKAIVESDERREQGVDRVRVLLGAGVLASLQADSVAALRWLEECVSLAEQLSDNSRRSYARAYIGVSYGQSADERALAPTEAARDWFEAAGDLYGLRLSLVVLATYQMLRGNVALSRSIAERAVTIARESGLDRELAIALQVLAATELVENDLKSARDHFRESIAALTRDPSVFWAARALQLLGLVTCRLGDGLRGARLLGAAERGRDLVGAALLPHDRQRLEPVIDATRDTVGEEAFRVAWQEGKALTLESAAAYALGDSANAATHLDGANASDERAVTPVLKVRTLGPLEIECDGRMLRGEEWQHQKPKELLLYLLTHPEGRSRDQIGLVFWPEATAAQVKNIFHVTLHHLRKALGRSDLIVFTADRYRIAWELGVWFDAAVFEATLSDTYEQRSAVRFAGRKVLTDTQALALYQSDFLGGEHMAEWHFEPRERLRRLYVEAMMSRLRKGSSNAVDDTTIEDLRRVVRVDQLNQEANALLVEALERRGLAEEAQAARAVFLTLWRRELGTEPAGMA